MSLLRSSVLVILSSLVLVGVPSTQGFPNGAPIEACIYQTVPNHPGTKPQPTESFGHEFVATSGTYGPGSVIDGKFIM